MTTTVPSRSTDAPAAPVTYGFGTGQPAGVWLGLGLAPLCLLGATLLIGVVAVTVGVPLLLAALPLLGAAVVCLVPVRGRPLIGWSGPLATHATSRVTDAARWIPPLPTTTLAPSPASPTRLRLPAEYGRPRLNCCADDPAIGVLADTGTRTATAAFTVAGVDRFPLLDPGEQDQLLIGWGHALAVLADTEPELVRLQLLDRATPADVLGDTRRQSVSDLDRVVEELAVEHDTVLVTQWQLPRAGDVDGFLTAGRCRSVVTPLLSTQLVARPLSADEFGAQLGRTFRLAAPPAGGEVGPVSRRAEWTHVRTDDTWHRSYAITRWPGTPVTAGWLSPLLLTTTGAATRTVAVHLQRVDPAEAARIARAARARAQLDRTDRARLGLTPTAAVDRAEQAGAGMDEELAAGYRTHRLAGVVTVSADSLAALDDAGRELRQAAAAARLELAPLHGQHDLGLAASAPLCRLRSRSQR